MANQPQLTDLLDRAPPVNLEAEQAVIGSMMLDSRAIDGAVQILRASDFHDPAHAELFTTVIELQQETGRFDMLLFGAKLQSKGLYEFVGGAAYIGKTFQSVPAYWHWKYYSLIVKEFAIRRRLQIAASQLYIASDEPVHGDPKRNIDALLGKAQGILDSVSQEAPTKAMAAGPEYIAHDGLDSILTRADGQDNSLHFGLSQLDSAIGGLTPGELTIVAARTSHGKTALCLNIAEHVGIKQQLPVLYVSLEMPRQTLIDRLYASLAGIDSWQIRTGSIDDNERAKLTAVARKLRCGKLTIDDAPNQTITTIAAKAREFKRDSGLALLVIDYLTLIEPTNPKDPRHEQVSQMSRRTKLLARELGIPVLCCAQINREAEKASDGKPKLHHLRESGAIEQDADAVLLTWVAPRKKDDDDGPRQAEVKIAKNRHGERDQVIKCVYFGKTCRFEEAATDYQEASAPQRTGAFDRWNQAQ